MKTNLRYNLTWRSVKEIKFAVDLKSTYSRQFYRFLLEHDDNKVATTLRALLSPILPPSEIQWLQAEIVDPKYQIRRQVSKRKIKYLVHFTRATNVASILKHGLIPRQHLADTVGPEKESAYINDRWRHDSHLDASCLSISFPNYQMFYRYQRRFPDAIWAILRIDPAVLWQLDCSFYITNAANKRMSSIPAAELKTASAFNELFEDYIEDNICIKRADLRLSPNLPTNPQAEVLVFGLIPPQLIRAVCLRRISDYSPHFHSTWQKIDVRIEPDNFAPRGDFEVWSRLGIKRRRNPRKS